jgi:hypothetical protein
MNDPRQTYDARLQARKATVAQLELRSHRIADLRLVAFIATGVVAYLSFGQRLFGPWAIAVPALLFVVLVVLHDRALRAQARADRAVRFYARGLARIDDGWMGRGEKGERHAPADHPYAADLDLFGDGSLFQLLCTARTAAGEATLAGWLLQTGEAADIRARQLAVQALRDRVDLREGLSVLGADVRAELDGDRLAAWGAERVELLPGWARPVSAGLAAVTLALLWAWHSLGWGPIPFLLAAGAEYALLSVLRPKIELAVAAVDRAGRDLELLAEIVARIEQEELAGTAAGVLQAALSAGGVKASVRIVQLERRVRLHEARANQFFRPFAFLLLWEVQCAAAIASWRRACGAQLGAWVQAVGELEALSALAGYAFEHPADPFPEIVDGPARFDGGQLGHPLLPANRCVRNDLSLNDPKRLLLVSGSNMSGKSTFLRTVGINAVLALAGAPVRAERLSISPVRLGATLRIQDSLQQGASRFYAEITRLKQILDLAGGDRPLLFLLDEILHGTNSHDRLIGAEALIRALLSRSALGLVTTHDLALARVVESLGGAAENAHFADTVQDGKLHFDYRKRAGVVQQSNAIALMQAVGLPL